MSWWLLTKPVPLFFFFLPSQLLPGSSSSWNAVLTDKQTHGSFAAIAGVVLYAFPAIQQNIWGVSTKEGSLHTTWDDVVMQTHFEIKKKNRADQGPLAVSITGLTVRCIFHKAFFFCHFWSSDTVSYDLQWRMSWVSCYIDLSPLRRLSSFVQTIKRSLEWVSVGLLYSVPAFSSL